MLFFPPAGLVPAEVAKSGGWYHRTDNQTSSNNNHTPPSCGQHSQQASKSWAGNTLGTSLQLPSNACRGALGRASLRHPANHPTLSCENSTFAVALTSYMLENNDSKAVKRLQMEGVIFFRSVFKHRHNEEKNSEQCPTLNHYEMPISRMRDVLPTRQISPILLQYVAMSTKSLQHSHFDSFAKETGGRKVCKRNACVPIRPVVHCCQI